MNPGVTCCHFYSLLTGQCSLTYDHRIGYSPSRYGLTNKRGPFYVRSLQGESSEELSSRVSNANFLQSFYGQTGLLAQTVMMETSARPLKAVTQGHDLFSKPSTTTTASTLSDELVIALCGPIGSPIHKVASLFGSVLADRYGYEAKPVIRLSDIIQEHTESVPEKPMFDRINRLIGLGNELREQYGASVLADLAIARIAMDREDAKQKSGGERYEPKRRVCHIIDSIKNKEEYDALRQVYRDMLYFVGVYSPVPLREKNLLDTGMSLANVYSLIDRDSGEEIAHGQSVRNTFPLSDFFLRVESPVDKPLNQKIERFLALIFNTEVVTPSAAETAMYSAASAAGNSACLSRQVGAALTDKAGSILAIGWNDVPRAGGGLYEFEVDDPLGEKDKRCMNLDGGKCFNDLEKHAIIERVVEDLGKIIKPGSKAEAVEVISRSKVDDLIEFSRSVHAEMTAIIQGCQTAGDRVRDGMLFTTTYPCHSCARHIILAGIKEVYYIEPYRKSLATKLHSDAITENEADTTKVRILPFDGISPTRYLTFFKAPANSRKDDKTGLRIQKNYKTAVPIFEVTLESLPALEAIVVKTLTDKKLIKVNESQTEKRI